MKHHRIHENLQVDVDTHFRLSASRGTKPLPSGSGGHGAVTCNAVKSTTLLPLAAVTGVAVALEHVPLLWGEPDDGQHGVRGPAALLDGADGAAAPGPQVRLAVEEEEDDLPRARPDVHQYLPALLLPHSLQPLGELGRRSARPDEGRRSRRRGGRDCEQEQHEEGGEE
uniref:Uncharacterized protein n=1 Tax=Triticum urartu TaxID=4572 RepID=A0A8R7VC47_TRIUA